MNTKTPLIGKDQFEEIFFPAAELYQKIVRSRIAILALKLILTHYKHSPVDPDTLIGREEVEKMRQDFFDCHGKQYRLDFSNIYSVMTEMIDVEERTDKMYRELMVYQSLLKVYFKNHPLPAQIETEKEKDGIKSLINYDGSPK